MKREEFAHAIRAVGSILGTSDLLVIGSQAKAVAHRAKDVEFCDALIEQEIVDPSVLRARLQDVRGIEESARQAAQERIDRAQGRDR